MPVAEQDGRSIVAALYRDHALGLIRLAHVMLGDKAAAEDVVQGARLSRGCRAYPPTQLPLARNAAW